MNKRLRIAQLPPYYYPCIGGVEGVTQYISEELVARGHEVHVLTAQRNHKGAPVLELPQYELVNGVQVFRFKSYLDVGHHGYFPGIAGPLLDNQYDLFHCHSYRQPQGEIATRIARRRHIPSVLHYHGGFFSNSRIKSAIYSVYDRLAKRKAVNRFSHFIALSDKDKEQLMCLNIHPDDISIIGNAADKKCFAKTSASGFCEKHGLQGKKVILYFSILHAYKRPDLLVQALPGIIAKVPDVFLLFAGPDAGEVARINAIGERLKVTGYFKWIGPVYGDEKHDAYEASSLLALPSDEDPYPLVLLEALAHGKPVVTTNVVGSAPLIKEYGAGVILDPQDVEGLEKAATDLLTTPNLREEMGKSGLRLALEKFSVKGVTDQLEDLYFRLLERDKQISWENTDLHSVAV